MNAYRLARELIKSALLTIETCTRKRALFQTALAFNMAHAHPAAGKRGSWMCPTCGTVHGQLPHGHGGRVYPACCMSGEGPRLHKSLATAR